MPAHPSPDQPQPKMKIDANEREQLWQLLREGGSKAMPDEMKVFVAGLQTAFGQYRHSAEEDHNTNGHLHRPTWAQSRMPIDLIVSGNAMSLFHASHAASMMAS